MQSNYAPKEPRVGARAAQRHARHTGRLGGARRDAVANDDHDARRAERNAVNELGRAGRIGERLHGGGGGAHRRKVQVAHVDVARRRLDTQRQARQNAKRAKRDRERVKQIGLIRARHTDAVHAVAGDDVELLLWRARRVGERASGRRTAATRGGEGGVKRWKRVMDADKTRKRKHVPPCQRSSPPCATTTRCRHRTRRRRP